MVAKFQTPTDFWERQTVSRKRSYLFILCFLVAVFITALFFQFVATIILIFFRIPPTLEVSLFLQVVFMLFMIAMSLNYVAHIKKGGGFYVAQMLKCRYLDRSDPDLPLNEAAFLNVVEEMCIAAGMPVPDIYVAPSSGINALVAGVSADDLVLVATEGLLKYLNRTEISGVVGHELGHLRHGDLLMNTYMAGWLKGLLLLSVLGRKIMESGTGGKKSGGLFNAHSGSVGMIVAGFMLILLGEVGNIMASLIQAGFSRQREDMADAASIEFNRDSSGLASALKKIGGHYSQSYVRSGDAISVRHFFIADPVRSLSSYLSSHPPLEKRILALEPAWDGEFINPAPDFDPMVGAQAYQERSTRFTQSMTVGLVAGAALADAAGPAKVVPVTHSFYDACPKTLADCLRRQDSLFLGSLPEGLLKAAKSPIMAAPLVAAIMVRRDEIDGKAKLENLTAYALDFFGEEAWAGVMAQLSAVNPPEGQSFLPLLDMALPAMADLDAAGRDRVNQAVTGLIKAGGRLDIFKLVIGYQIKRYLNPDKNETVGDSETLLLTSPQLREAIELICSVMARQGNLGEEDDSDALISFNRAMGSLQFTGCRLKDADQLSVKDLIGAIKVATTAASGIRLRIFKALAESAMVDRQVTLQEYELLRAYHAAVN